MSEHDAMAEVNCEMAFGSREMEFEDQEMKISTIGNLAIKCH